jgi:hypothetical protein
MMRALWVWLCIVSELAFSADARREWRHDVEGEGEKP